MTSKECADYLIGQLGGEAAGVSTRKMFGDYGVYCNGKFVGVICDGSLYLKPTQAGEALLAARGELNVAPAYEGASPSYRMDCVEDAALCRQVLEATWAALPFPKPKKKPAKPQKA